MAITVMSLLISIVGFTVFNPLLAILREGNTRRPIMVDGIRKDKGSSIRRLWYAFCRSLRFNRRLGTINDNPCDHWGEWKAYLARN